MNFKELQATLQTLTNSKVSYSEIGKALGLKLSTISTRAGKDSQLKFKEITKIESYFHVNLSENVSKLACLVEQIDNNNSLNIEHSFIKYYPDVFLSAGYGVEVFDESFETVVIDSRFLISERGNKVKPDNCRMVRISGNSMFPEYHHGDRVIIDESDTNLTDGQIYAFRYDGQCYVKEINRAGNKIKCISVNKEYEPFFIERDTDFKVFGRIIPRVRL